MAGPFLLGNSDSAPCSYAEADPQSLQFQLAFPWSNAFQVQFEAAGTSSPVEVHANGELVRTVAVEGSCESGGYVHSSFDVIPQGAGDPPQYVLLEIGLPAGSSDEASVFLREISIYGYWVTASEQRTWGSIKARF